MFKTILLWGSFFIGLLMLLTTQLATAATAPMTLVNSYPQAGQVVDLASTPGVTLTFNNDFAKGSITVYYNGKAPSGATGSASTSGTIVAQCTNIKPTNKQITCKFTNPIYGGSIYTVKYIVYVHVKTQIGPSIFVPVTSNTFWFTSSGAQSQRYY